MFGNCETSSNAPLSLLGGGVLEFDLPVTGSSPEITSFAPPNAEQGDWEYLTEPEMQRRERENLLVGNRSRARPRCIGVLCRQRPPFVLQLFCSGRPIVKRSDSRRHDKGSEPLKMGVLESGRILETISKQAVHANMGGPNQPVRQQPELLVKDRKCDEQQGCYEDVEQVVEGCPEPYIQQIA
jgi:hypothetical protein